MFTRDEVEMCISDPGNPVDRQMVYGLEFLAGLRHGEMSGLRWRHYDQTLKPLGQLLVAVSYSSTKGRVKSTKTEAIRYVPVHPTLAAMLAEWKLAGWAGMMGRQPKPDDLIVPLPPAHAARRRSASGESFRSKNYSGKRFREADLPALGMRHRRMHYSRATFITLALEDGANPHIIETRVTHTRKARARSAFDGYNRGRQWEITCRELGKLRITRKSRGTVVESATPLLQHHATKGNRGRNVVEAPGVEAGGGEFCHASTRIASGWKRRGSRSFFHRGDGRSERLAA